MRILLSSKIHRAYVTNTDPDYIGSIAIDRALMDKADLWEYEKVLVCDVTNGNRWETYTLAAPPGSGDHFSPGSRWPSSAKRVTV